MKPPFFLCYLGLFLVLFLLYQRRKSVKARVSSNLLQRKGHNPMEEIIQKYMGRLVYITTIQETHFGTISAYSNGWVTLVNKKNEPCEINGDYIVKIQPKAEKTKKTDF